MRVARHGSTGATLLLLFYFILFSYEYLATYLPDWISYQHQYCHTKFSSFHRKLLLSKNLYVKMVVTQLFS